MPATSVLAVIFAGLSVQTTPNEEALRLTNVTIKMVGHFIRGANRVEAKVTNPNDFPVYDVVADCSVNGRRGSSGASFTLTIADAIQASATRVFRDLHVDAWPEGAKMAYCISSEVKRLPDRSTD